MKKIIALAAAALLAVGAQAATGHHHAPKAVSAHAAAQAPAQAGARKDHKLASAPPAGKKAMAARKHDAQKHDAQKHAALKPARKAGRKHA